MYKTDLTDFHPSVTPNPGKAVLDNCNDCGLCLKECLFLSQYGTPGQIVKKLEQQSDLTASIAFECSLCGLCDAVCPKALDPSLFFLKTREELTQKNNFSFPGQNRLLNFEKRGTSKTYSFYSLPENCDTIFFPGCALPGSHPGATLKTYIYLKEHIDRLGIVLDCCTKPSHDFGRMDFFNQMFSELKSYLSENGVNTILVACPSCHKMFRTYAPEFRLETVYEVMARTGIKISDDISEKLAVHDPCAVRFENKIHDSVRTLLSRQGFDMVEMPHEKDKTFCCGEGGAAGCMAPHLAYEWPRKRAGEAKGNNVATYCAGCVHYLSKNINTMHALDLIFYPQETVNNKRRVYKAPFTYLNRMLIKRKLKKISSGTTRERTFNSRANLRKNKAATFISMVAFGLFLAWMSYFGPSV